VHDAFYCLLDSTFKFAEVSKLLPDANEGKASQWAGEKFNEIGLDEEAYGHASNECQNVFCTFSNIVL